MGMTGPSYGANLALSSFSSPEAEDWLPKSKAAFVAQILFVRSVVFPAKSPE